MAIRTIVKLPDSILREKAQEVLKITPRTHKLLDDMMDTMHHANGIGLAAPQIGISKRVIVVNIGEESEKIELINPIVIEKSGEQLGPEGCLSIPGLSGDVRRAEQITVRGLDRKGHSIDVSGSGLMARVLQHEIDHLNGVLFIDIADAIYEPEEHEDD